MKKIRNLMVLMVMVIAFGLAIMGTAVAHTDTDTDLFTITVNEVAEIEVGGSAHIANFTVTAGNAGVIPTVSAASTTSYLHFTTVVVPSGSLVITADILSTSDFPDGITLHILADDPTGTGTLGHSEGEKDFTLETPGPEVLIEEIGSCYTGTTNTSGAHIHASITINNIADLLADGYDITLRYTLTDDNS
jgi:hypothetical protein